MAVRGRAVLAPARVTFWNDEVIEASLGRLAAGEDLSLDEMSAAIEAVVLGR